MARVSHLLESESSETPISSNMTSERFKTTNGRRLHDAIVVNQVISERDDLSEEGSSDSGPPNVISPEGSLVYSGS